MNQGMNPGFTPLTEIVSASTVGIEVINLSGAFIPKSGNFELTLVGGGSGGESGFAGGSSAGSLVKRVIGARPGLVWSVIIGTAGAIPRLAGGLSMLIPPPEVGIATMIAPGAGANSVAGALATGGDINYPGQAGQGVFGGGVGLGGMGGGTPFSLAGVQQSGGLAITGSGPGAGGAAADPTGASVGQPGQLIVRYF